MQHPASSAPSGPPGARLVTDRRGAAVRAGVLAAGLALSVLCGGGGWLAAGLGVVWFAAALLRERGVVLREAELAGQAALRSQEHAGRRAAEARLMALDLAYDRSRSVLEALREGVLVVDGAGEIVTANPAVLRALREPARDPVGRPLWEVLRGELAERAREAFHAMRERSDNQAELPQIRYSGIPCGDRVYDLTAVEAKSLRTGQDFGTVFLLVDSTRNYELQSLKDRFLSSVSHELRTPLTNICAYAEILSHMQPDELEEWPEFVEVIHEEGLQLSTLVDAMFDYLQLESGEAVFTEERCDGLEHVQAIVARCRPAAELRGIELGLCVAGAPPALSADQNRFTQVVRHLLDNAVKFAPNGGRVQVTVRAADGGFELRIEDNGPGVPVDDRQAVFEKFNQLRDHLTDKPTGTGIGLASSRAIVARLGGLIWCEESPLGGAAFVVMLPGEHQPKLAGFGAGLGAGGGF